MASALSNRQNCACARKTLQHNEDGHTAPGVCGNGSVPLSHSGNVVTRIGIHTYTNSLRMVEFSPIWLINKVFKRYLRNPGRDISFPIFTRKQIETKIIRKEIKTIISSLNHFLSFLSNILEQKLKQEYWKGNQNKKYLVLST